MQAREAHVGRQAEHGRLADLAVELRPVRERSGRCASEQQWPDVEVLRRPTANRVGVVKLRLVLTGQRCGVLAAHEREPVL
jgi:hypothetical protein